jgi:acylphosphatase
LAGGKHGKDSPTVCPAPAKVPWQIARGSERGSDKIAGLRPQSRAAVRETQAAKRYFVSGMVQGVGFRYFARHAARRLGVSGYAKNLRDGRVEVYAIGTAEMLLAMRAKLEEGPRSATVSSVAEEDASIDPEFATEFSIERDAW